MTDHIQLPRLGRPRDIGIAAIRIERLEKTAQQCLDHLDEQAAELVALRAATYDDTRSARGPADPTLGTIVSLDAVEYRRNALGDAIATLTLAVNVLEAACTEALRYRAHREPPEDTDERCIGDGTPQGATCHQIPDERPDGHGGRITDGRCLDCGARYDQRLADARAQRDAARAERASYQRKYQRDKRRA